MTNPYAPPEAELGVAKAPRRPLGVWLISGVYGIASAGSLIGISLVATGLLGEAPPEWRQLIAAGWPSWLAAGGNLLLVLAFSVALFLLRRVAVVLIAASSALSVGALAAGWTSGGRETWLLDAARVAVLLAVLLYGIRLRARGVLR